MKKFTILFSLLLSATFSFAQFDEPCLPEGITFTTQTQIDSFPINYPDCQKIQGDVNIDEGENLNITNLNGLNGLTSIFGHLSIFSTSLLDMTGLENINRIDGDLLLGQNSNLSNLNGLDNLTSIGGNLTIMQNSIVDLTGLGSLDSIGGYLRIVYNSQLSNCEIEPICAYLTDPNGRIYISDNADGCLSMIEVAIACGTTMPCLEEETISLQSQFDVDHFPMVFPECTDPGCSVYISGGDIVNLDSLSMITSIGGDLSFGNNTVLTSLTGLENVTSIGGDLYIYGNDALVSLTGLENLYSIGRDLDILFDNDALVSLTGLDKLTTIGGDLRIGDYHFWGNDNLKSLTGLENLTFIGEDLYIYGNDALTTLTGLENLSFIGGNLSITSNSALSNCEAEGICAYLSDPNGVIKIYDNAPGCNSQQEVQEACWIVHIEEGQVTQNQFTFYPNPVTANAKLSGEFASSKTINICIYNTTGLCLKSWEFASQQSGEQEFTLNLNDLPPGIYFLHLQAGNEVVTKKVVKL